MFCGTSSFNSIAGDDAPKPKCSRKKKKKQSKNKNPYSSRGLDKFTSVLSDLETRREKIMASTGAQGIAMIRFVYSNSQDWIPVIVRLRDEGNGSNHNNNSSNQASAVPSSQKIPEEVDTTSQRHTVTAVAPVKKFPWWKWRSAYCMPVMAVVLLVCLVIFGRVFAICCTSIWWYLVPTLQGEEGKRMRSRVSRKKEYVKKMSEKKLPVAAAAAVAATPTKMIGSGVQTPAPLTVHGTNGKK